jgi:hypothetical protein
MTDSQRWIYLKYEERCGGACGRMLAEGTRVRWDPEEHEILCESCAELAEGMEMEEA